MSFIIILRYYISIKTLTTFAAFIRLIKHFLDVWINVKLMFYVKTVSMLTFGCYRFLSSICSRIRCYRIFPLLSHRKSLQKSSNESLSRVRWILPWWWWGPLVPALDEVSPELGAGETVDGEAERSVESHHKTGKAGQNFVPD